jgi:hypothetical protein
MHDSLMLWQVLLVVTPNRVSGDNPTPERLGGHVNLRLGDDPATWKPIAGADLALLPPQTGKTGESKQA